MTESTAVERVSEHSPFDQIRKTREDGTEYWSARDLMGLMGYARWQTFQPIASKAWNSAAGLGLGGPEHFTQVRKVAASGPDGVDVELSRLACYLVALAADESKPRVAEAKLYFAVQTRKQEVAPAPARELSRKELLLQALAAEEERERLQLELEAAQPKVEGYERLVETEGHFSLATAAQMLDTGRQRLIFELAKYGAIMNKPGTTDHLRPYQQHVKAGRFVVKTQEVPIEHRDGSKETIVKGTTLVTPKGLDWIRAQRRAGGGDILARRQPSPELVEAASVSAARTGITVMSGPAQPFRVTDNRRG